MARIHVWGAILALATAALAPVAVAEAAAKPVTLYLWVNAGEMPRVTEPVRNFERLHDGRDGKPAIKVVIGQSAQLEPGEDLQRLLCAITGGAPPDVVMFGRHCVAEWAGRDAFLCLQPYIDRDQRERPDDPATMRREQFYAPCWNEALYEGRLYAVPTDTDNRALYYNLDLVEKHEKELIAAGCVDPNDPTKFGPPRTWEQLRKAGEILTEYDSRHRLSRVGFIPNYGNSWLCLYGWLNGGEMLSPDGRTCTLNSPAFVDALTYMTEMYDDMGGAEPVYAFQSSRQVGGDLDPFFDEQIAMKIDGSWFLNQIATYRRNLRFAVALPPAPREGMPRFGWCGGWSYTIPRGAEHPDEAWELIRYLMSPEAFRIQMQAMRQQAAENGVVFMPHISARSDHMDWVMREMFLPDPTVEQKFKDAMQVFLDALPVSRYRPVTPVGGLLWTEHIRGMEGGLFKRYDPDPRRSAQISLDRSTAVVQAELDRIYNPVHYPTLTWMPMLVTYVALLGFAFAFVYWRFGRATKARGYFRREFGAGYLFASPWFVGFVVFGGGPILFSLFMSFCEYDIFSPPKFVGFKNYTDMFQSPLFYKSLYNTVYMAIGIPIGMAVGLGIAMLLNYEVKGMAVYRTFFYLPAIMPAVAASLLWLWIFNPQQGVLNTLLREIGLPGPGWLQDQFWSKPALILMGLWGAGASMIIWLAGLKGIPQHLYEAAEIDGAGPLRRFWNITLPMLSPYIFFNLIMGLIGTFQIFTQAYVMTRGGPVDSTLFYAYALFNEAFRYLRMGYASAMAWVLFGIVFLLTFLQMRLASRWVHYESEG